MNRVHHQYYCRGAIMYPLRRFLNGLLLIFIVVTVQSCFNEVVGSGTPQGVTVNGVLKVSQRICMATMCLLIMMEKRYAL